MSSSRLMAKLVRDKIPEMMQRGGIHVKTHVASQTEYDEALREALIMEMSEYLDATSAEEMVDVIEVLYAIAAARGWSIAHIEKVREEKAKNLGGFSERIILE